MEVQLEVVVDATWARAQGLVAKAPVPEVLKVKFPAGKLAGPLSVSLTVAVQVVLVLMKTEAGVQLTDAEVVRLVAVAVALPGPELAPATCSESPP